MKFNRIISFALCAMAAWSSAVADGPFRAHRYDSFQATPTEPGQILFAGNSITNMHSWFEAFGSHQEVIGRGNSGGFAYELLDNLESYISAKPAKMFVMIGTNDVSSGVSAELTSRRIQAIITRVRLESPETELYIESILPRSNNPKVDYENCNTLTKNYIAQLNDPKVHFVNLSQVCAPLNGNSTWTHDGLHPRPTGYAAWCHEIEGEVGYPTVYPATITTQESCGLSLSGAARVEQFPYFPVSEGDVLIFGDEQIHGGEWHELLRSNKIKDRGQGWGWGGMNLVQAKAVVASALKDQAVKPAKIFLSYGIGGTDATNYRAIVDEAKKQAPDAKIYLVSLTPSANTTTDAGRVSFNTTLQTIATEKGATYVDIYTPLKADLSKNIMHTNYVSGRGYVVMANKFAEYLTEEGVNPVSLDEYEAVYTNRARRNIIGKALTRVLVDVTYGTLPGQTNPEYKDQIEAKFNELVALVNKEGLTDAEANEGVAGLNDVINKAFNMPAISNDTEEHWFTFASSRGNRYLSTSGTALIGAPNKPVRTVGNDVWKLVDRGDNTYDLVNYLGEYVSPVAGYNSAMSVTEERPSTGWQISFSNNTSGTYVIYTSNCQLNQTNRSDLAVFNWYSQAEGRSTPDRDDQGCSYSIAPFEGQFIDPTAIPTTGWYVIEGAQGLSHLGAANCIVNADSEFKQNNTNFYALKFETKPADKAPRAYVHVTINDNVWQFTALNGRGVKENCTSDRASLSADNPVVSATGNDMEYAIGKWSTYVNTAGTFVGKSSASNNTYRFTRVSDEELAAYDAWTVTINALNGVELPNDTHVTLDIPENQGIATVYNGGTFFLTKGTALNADMFVVTPTVNVKQEVETPTIEIDPVAKTVYVNYTSMLSGWYTVAMTAYDGTRADLKTPSEAAIAAGENYLTATDTEYHQVLGAAHNYYHVALAAANSERPACNFFRVVQPQSTVFNITSISGHHVLANGCASREANDITVSETSDNHFSMPLCLWPNNNVGYEGNLVGSFTGNTSTYEVQPVDMSLYDVYKLQILGEVSADAIADDVKVTLNSTDNLGLDAVYNGGVFFVNRDAVVTADNVVVTAHNNVDKPQVTVAPGVITVDYTKIESSICELGVPAASHNGAAYDLTGRRVAKPANGIFIIDGRKVRL